MEMTSKLALGLILVQWRARKTQIHPKWKIKYFLGIWVTVIISSLSKDGAMTEILNSWLLPTLLDKPKFVRAANVESKM